MSARLALALLLASLLTAQPHTLASLIDGTAFVRIPAGELIMGSTVGNADELPLRRIRIMAAFEMGKFEVTQAQWDSLMRDPHSSSNAKERKAQYENPSNFKGPAHPVERVSWAAVQLFIAALNSRDPKHIYRLPTEAEWEYAAKAGSSEDVPKNLNDIAWHMANSGGETHPVGEKAANPWGLHDIFGNVFEWVQDWYVPEPYANSPATEPQSAAGSYKVYRGCSWHSEVKYCRPAYRAFDFPIQGQYSVGFRLVRTQMP